MSKLEFLGKRKIDHRRHPNRPPKRLTDYKKAVKLEEGLTVARLKGELRFKKTKKGLDKSIREHIGKAIDRIDPLEALAVIGLTPAIYIYIKESPKLSNLLLSWGWFGAIGIGIGLAFEQFGIPYGLEAYGVPLDTKETPQQMLVHLGLALSVSYIIIHHGGQLMGLLEKTVPEIVGMF